MTVSHMPMTMQHKVMLRSSSQFPNSPGMDSDSIAPSSMSSPWFEGSFLKQ